ncbi:MAG: arginine N-succinyltransferase [Pirellulaceae bacterium]
MLVVRRVEKDDLDPLFELIQKSEFGLTTLKVSKDKLEERIEQSLFAFSQTKARPSGQPYVFVMEDLTQGKIVGTSAIYSKVGGYEPFYSYQIHKSLHHSDELGVHKEIDVLHLRVEHNGPTEIGSLFLSPDYWGGGHGRLLSMSRLLFMADFPKRFEQEVVAEMRGVVHKDGHCPLWAALGSHFFQIEFPKAETLTSESKKFIADLMPKHPIYIPLLPQEAQDVIGNVHPNTEPALAMLKKEGFEFRNLVDIFDGGPTMHCDFEKIRAIKTSRQLTVGQIVKDVDGPELLLSNSDLNFRACLGNVLEANDSTATIDQVTALRLELRVGDTFRCVELKPLS